MPSGQTVSRDEVLFATGAQLATALKALEHYAHHGAHIGPEPEAMAIQTLQTIQKRPEQLTRQLLRDFAQETVNAYRQIQGEDFLEWLRCRYDLPDEDESTEQETTA